MCVYACVHVCAYMMCVGLGGMPQLTVEVRGQLQSHGK